MKPNNQQTPLHNIWAFSEDLWEIWFVVLRCCSNICSPSPKLDKTIYILSAQAHSPALLAHRNDENLGPRRSWWRPWYFLCGVTSLPRAATDTATSQAYSFRRLLGLGEPEEWKHHRQPPDEDQLIDKKVMGIGRLQHTSSAYITWEFETRHVSRNQRR